MCLSEEEQQLVFREVSSLKHQSLIKDPKREALCPHCGSSNVSRYGKTQKGYQRLFVSSAARFWRKERRMVGKPLPQESLDGVHSSHEQGASIKL
jgi:hypothetical protein